jgi:hypothetical protein
MRLARYFSVEAETGREVPMRTRLVSYAAVMAVIFSIGLHAQTREVNSKSKATIKNGTEISTTGCVDRMADGRFALTSVGGATQYVLVGKDDLAKYVGHRVEIRGKATDFGNGKVKTKTKTKTDVEHGPDRESKVTSEQKGDVSGLPMLGVKSVRTLAMSCP